MINTFVIKAIRACNLRCPYCYYINEDTKEYGSIITIECLDRLYESYAKYAASRNIHGYFIWHGGEPLLLGRDRFAKYIERQKQYFEPEKVSNHVQTNAVLLDDDWLDLFETLNIHVGVSLDGNRNTHDRNRPRLNGKGTYDDVIAAINRLTKRDQYVGALSVIDPTSDPKETLTLFREIGVQFSDLLLPMTNHARQRTSSRIDIEGVSTFLRNAFQEWVTADDPSLGVRFFSSLIENALGLEQRCFNAGVSPSSIGRVIIIETDGRICLDTEFGEIDRFGFGSEYETGITLFDREFSFSDVEVHLGKWAEDKGFNQLPSDCQSCCVRSVCRGSHPGTRYDDKDNSFNHPSAYCEAMYALCGDIIDYLDEHGLVDRFADPSLRSSISNSSLLKGDMQ